MGFRTSGRDSEPGAEYQRSQPQEQFPRSLTLGPDPRGLAGVSSGEREVVLTGAVTLEKTSPD